MRVLFSTVAVLGLLAVGSLPAPAQEWTRFRGPNGSGISDAKNIPSEWKPDDIRWRTGLPGSGHSSPVVWGDKVFVTSGDEKARKIALCCVNTVTGNISWTREFPFSPFRKHNYNTFASGSPCVDRDRVYISLALPESYLVAAFTHDGQKIWQADLGRFASQHGGGHSPILYDGMLIVENDQDGESFISGLDASSGREVWKLPRRSKEAAYATPCVWSQGPDARLVFSSESHGISAVEPKTGKLVWELPEVFDKRVVSSPYVAGGFIIGSCGSGGGGNYVVAVKPPDGEKGGGATVAYTIRKSASYVPTSVAYGSRLFVWSDGGIVTCADLATGEVKWQERVGGNYFGSPVWVDGRLFCASTKGEVVVVEATDTFKVLARNSLNELTHSTPAVSGGRMFVHTSEHLVCIGPKAN